MVATRASDADREACLEDIETAYADGRIDTAERERRTQAALQATTLPELAALVADLGPAVTLPQRAAAPGDGPLSRRALRTLTVGVLVLAFVVVTAWVVAGASGDADGTAPSGVAAPATPQSAVPDRLRLHTASGLGQLVALTRERFGTTLVESAAIYPDYASIEIVEKEDPRRIQRWYFARGFEGEPNKGSRSPDAVSIDLAAIDPAAYVKAIRRAPAVLGVEDVTNTYVLVRASDGRPTFSVYVSNEYSESGYYTFTAQGEEIYRYAFE